MTNYNERLDKIIRAVYNRGYVDGEPLAMYDKPRQMKQPDAKQAITSLTKELVAEAKPEKKSTKDYGSWEEGHRNAGWNNCLKHYEQNLLKALEKK